MEAGNKRSSCSDDSKYGALILGKSEQRFKIQSHFLIFDPIIGEVQLCDYAESHHLKYICELFVKI